MNDLFELRDALDGDVPVLNMYANIEGMDSPGSAEGVRVACNADGDIVGFIRIVTGENSVAHVNPVVTYSTWRGYGVGRALVEDALSTYGELRLVARGKSIPFYERMGFTSLPWEAIAPEIACECDGCEMRDECGPLPMGKTL